MLAVEDQSRWRVQIGQRYLHTSIIAWNGWRSRTSDSAPIPAGKPNRELECSASVLVAPAILSPVGLMPTLTVTSGAEGCRQGFRESAPSRYSQLGLPEYRRSSSTATRVVLRIVTVYARIQSSGRRLPEGEVQRHEGLTVSRMDGLWQQLVDTKSTNNKVVRPVVSMYANDALRVNQKGTLTSEENYDI